MVQVKVGFDVRDKNVFQDVKNLANISAKTK